MMVSIRMPSVIVIVVSMLTATMAFVRRVAIPRLFRDGESDLVGGLLVSLSLEIDDDSAADRGTDVGVLAVLIPVLGAGVEADRLDGSGCRFDVEAT